MTTNRPKILIADDDDAIVDSITMMLEMMDYQVYSVTKGNDIPEALRQEPNLLLLDIWMSGIDGRDICRQIKSTPSTNSLPVLMISASRQIKQSALSCGADDFLAKPFEMSVLIEKIEALISTEK